MWFDNDKLCDRDVFDTLWTIKEKIYTQKQCEPILSFLILYLFYFFIFNIIILNLNGTSKFMENGITVASLCKYSPTFR